MSEKKKAKIAFTVVQNPSGFYEVLTDAPENVEVERQPSIVDIKLACIEIKDAILRNEVINSVLGILAQKEAKEKELAPEAEEVSAPEAE